MTDAELTEAAAWKRVGDLIRLRRTAMGLTQLDLQRSGAPSAAKVREIENGRTTTLSPSKRRDLERALGWPLGGFDEALERARNGDLDVKDVASNQGREATTPLAASLSREEIRERSRFMHPSRRAALAEAAGDEELAQILHRISVGEIDPGLQQRARYLLEQINIDSLPRWIEQLSREGKVRLAEYAQELLQAEMMERLESHELEAASTEGAPSPEDDKKNQAALGRDNDGALNGQDQGAGADEVQSDYDLALREGDGPSLGRRIRDQHDAAAEAPDDPGPEDGA